MISRQCRFESPGRSLESDCKRCMGRRRRKKDVRAEVELAGSMDCFRRVSRKTEEEHDKQHVRTPGHTHTFLRNRETSRSGTAEQFGCTWEQEIPLASSDDFPSTPCEFECEKKIVPKGGTLQEKTQTKEQRSADWSPHHFHEVNHRWTRPTSTHSFRQRGKRLTSPDCFLSVRQISLQEHGVLFGA